MHLGSHGSRCPLSGSLWSTNESLVVVASNGLHIIKARFCFCQELSESFTTQLLRAGWWPATTGLPKTVVTIEVMQRYEELAARGKTSMNGFYLSLEDATKLKSTARPKVSDLMPRLTVYTVLTSIAEQV